MDFLKLRESMPAGIKSDLTDKAMAAWVPGLRAAESDDTENTITILDVIGQDFWTGEGVTSKRIGAALRRIGNDNPVTVLINSPGGDMWEGVAINSLLSLHKGKVTVKVLGLAASAASVIAMAADEIQMAPASFFMIHNAWVVAAGNRNEFQELATWLEPFDWAMAAVYSKRADLDQAAAQKLMDEEAWIGAEAAIDQGFADGILGESLEEVSDDSDPASAQAALRKIDHGLAASGMTRKQRRELINTFKAGMSGAASGDDTHNAIATGKANQTATELKGIFT